MLFSSVNSTVPVNVQSATEDHSVRFHQIHLEDMERVRVRKFCVGDDLGRVRRPSLGADADVAHSRSPSLHRRRHAPLAEPGGAQLVRPFIARTTREPLPDMADVIAHAGRVAYRNETPADRDAHGALWARQAHAPHVGYPLFGKIHSARQRHAMLHLLCQICGQEPDENTDGVLWLLPTVPVRLPDDDGNGIITTYPPVCRPCASLALRQCPPLRHAHAVLRVRDVQVYGVSGAAFTLTASSAVFREAIDCPYDSPDLAGVVAVQQLLRLTDYSDAQDETI